MSKSGIPGVSQVAEAVNTTVSSVGDIFSGKNVFESLGRIGAAPFAAAADLTNDVTFHTLEKVPIAGEVLSGGSQFAENPYSADAAKKFGIGAAKGAAVALSAGYAAPLLGVSPLVAGAGAAALTSGNLSGGLGALAGAPGLSDILPEGITSSFDSVKNLLGSIGTRAPASANDYLPQQNYSQPAQTLVQNNQGAVTAVVIIAIGFGVYLYMRK